MCASGKFALAWPPDVTVSCCAPAVWFGYTTLISHAPAATPLIEYVPCELVVPVKMPRLTRTVAPLTGWLFSSNTEPHTVPVPGSVSTRSALRNYVALARATQDQQEA